MPFRLNGAPKRLADDRITATGEPPAQVAVKAGATVRFKVSPILKAEALAGLKTSRRKATRVG